MGSNTYSLEYASAYGLVSAANIIANTNIASHCWFVTSIHLHKGTLDHLHAQSHDLTHSWSFHQCSKQQQHTNNRSIQQGMCNKGTIRFGDCQQPHPGTHQCLSVSLGTQKTPARLASCGCHCEVCLECGLHCMRLRTGLTCLWPHQHVPHQHEPHQHMPHQHVLVYSDCCCMLLDSHPCRQLVDGQESSQS